MDDALCVRVDGDGSRDAREGLGQGISFHGIVSRFASQCILGLARCNRHGKQMGENSKIVSSLATGKTAATMPPGTNPLLSHPTKFGQAAGLITYC